MDNSSSNPYSTPDSDVSAVNLNSAITTFERFSAWGVFGLSCVTLGIYPIYWLYTRSGTLNSFHSNQISSGLLKSFVLIVIASFIIQIIAAAVAPTGVIWLTLNALIQLAYVILYFVVLFKLRNRLKEILEDNINSVITVFGSAIYLQYKINKGIDAQGK